ncbi:MAG: hypothetical protein P4N59_13070 [Negativicutes bacterium]|nr:hypothetical protein [Negativicutes bacterium]
MTYRASLVMVGLLIPTIAMADVPNDVTLLMDNEAGMVTKREGLTQRECDAVVVMLSALRPQGVLMSGIISTWQIYDGAITHGASSGTIVPSPASPNLKSAKCVRDTKPN